ncbi:MAG: 3-isopropylmalate dehydratase small subunit [Synergistetes bacterium]|nr:3-isopropylmalate dehydratase small subunit [Synergistota bacterium]
MEKILIGRAFKLGDDINTDYIIAGKYTKTLDYAFLAEHLLEDVDPTIVKRLKKGDFLVAGKNFGCGSSREQAAIAIKYAGVGAVLAKSFARIFFRNAINLGLPALTCDTDQIDDGDQLIVNLESFEVENLTKSLKIPISPLNKVMLEILREGGLIPYLKKHGDFVL